ncbi:hypothetical cytosolic protein [Syntrophus aciditrophicus SB]|uniref:Hypothetical cytosolic protein n=1 Tax=Syntrophus aciditrophicus (strain SB) TaxID=56780 RepID=Q2LUX2_SYNAS|nr:hypothetical cytosolic protein [Syntrophus aciditrophicus SB]
MISVFPFRPVQGGESQKATACAGTNAPARVAIWTILCCVWQCREIILLPVDQSIYLPAKIISHSALISILASLRTSGVKIRILEVTNQGYPYSSSG